MLYSIIPFFVIIAYEFMEISIVPIPANSWVLLDEPSWWDRRGHWIILAAGMVMIVGTLILVNW